MVRDYAQEARDVARALYASGASFLEDEPGEVLLYIGHPSEWEELSLHSDSKVWDALVKLARRKEIEVPEVKLAKGTKLKATWDGPGWAIEVV